MAFELITAGLTTEQMDEIHQVAVEVSAREGIPYLTVVIDLYRQIREQREYAVRKVGCR